jgi:hypothetical protein
MTTLVTTPTLIETDRLKFLIMDTPKEENMQFYVQVMTKNDVVRVARASETQYNQEEIERAGIQLHVKSFLRHTHL